MIIVSDTSPLCNLQLVDSLWLLRELYGIVIIPQKKNASLVTWGRFWVRGAIIRDF
jgi:predicted nucleic acid-binding protein